MADPVLRLGDHVQPRGRVIEVALWYPRSDHEFDTVEVDLIDVRAAEPIRIAFDFDRDGWSIMRKRSENDTECDESWQEAAFVTSWSEECLPDVPQPPLVDRTPTIREACRRRMPLGGADAQCLEHALTMTERERDAALARADDAETQVSRWRHRARDMANRISPARPGGEAEEYAIPLAIIAAERREALERVAELERERDDARNDAGWLVKR